MHILLQIIKYLCFQFQSKSGPKAFMMVIKRVVGRTCHVTHGDIYQIPNFINKTTLDKSRMLLVYENLFKYFQFLFIL